MNASTTRFLAFHAANPDVYTGLVRLALKWVAHRPAQPMSMQMFLEVLRWQEGFATHGDPYRINNDFAAYYARLLMHRNPEMAGLFEIRASKADAFGHRPHPEQAPLWQDALAETTWLDEAA